MNTLNTQVDERFQVNERILDFCGGVIIVPFFILVFSYLMRSVYFVFQIYILGLFTLTTLHISDLKMIKKISNPEFAGWLILYTFLCVVLYISSLVKVSQLS